MAGWRFCWGGSGIEWRRDLRNEVPFTCLVNRGGQIVQLRVDPPEADACVGLQGLAQHLEGDAEVEAGGAEGAGVLMFYACV